MKTIDEHYANLLYRYQELKLEMTRFSSSESILSFRRQNLHLLCTLLFETLQTFYVHKQLHWLDALDV